MVPPIQKSVNVWRTSKLVKQTVQPVVQDSLNVQTVVKVPSLNTVPKHSKPRVSCRVATHAQYAISKGLPQKKGIRPVVKKTEIKLVKGASFVNHCLSAKSVPNVPNVVKELGVGGRLQTFWPKWQELGANPRVVSILKEGYALPFKMRPPLDTVSSHHKWLCKSGKKPGSVRGLSCTKRKVGSRKGGCTDLPVLLQPVVLGPKAQQKVETHFGPQPVKPLSPNKHIQDGNSGNHQGLLTKRGMGHVAGFQRRLLSYPHPSQIQKIPQVLFEHQGISVHSPSIRASHGSVGIYQGGKRGEIVGSDKGYKNPPVPRQLVAQSPVPGNLPMKYPDPLGPVPRIRLGGQHGEVRTGTPASVQFRRLPVRSPDGTGSTHARALGDIKGETSL